jgi:hypothetical protein
MVSDVPFSGEETCAATIRNKFYGDVGALRCLASGVADVAFINSYNLSINLRKYRNITYYRQALRKLIDS